MNLFLTILSDRLKYLKYAFLFLFLLISFQVKLSSQSISQFAEVSLLTVKPGNKLYSLFGHSAIRVSDPVYNIDFVYNFGAFDFSTPFFYFRFIRGNLDYYLSRSDFAELQYEIFTEKRSLWEQELKLSFGEKEVLYRHLDSLYNTGFHYRYRFFTDNCATRIPGVLAAVTGDSLKLNLVRPDEKMTYRRLIAPYLRNRPLIFTGVNMLLGRDADREPGAAGYLFLPDFVMKAFINSRDDGRILAGEPALIYRAYHQPNRRYSKYIILLFIIMVLIFVLTLAELSGRFSLRWFDVCLFFVAGLLGSFMIFTWFWSFHSELRDNLNILWLNPLNFILVYLRLKKIKSKTINYVTFIGILFLNLCFTAGVLSGYQHIVLPMVPFIILIVIRQLAIWWQADIRSDKTRLII